MWGEEADGGGEGGGKVVHGAEGDAIPGGLECFCAAGVNFDSLAE